jgi:uncharacterized membrane protein YphA (DoxX/SURF4 family)
MGWIFVRSGLGKLMDINAFIASMPGGGAGMARLCGRARGVLRFFARFFPSRKQSSE